NGGLNGNETELSENTLLVLKAIESNEKLTQQQISDNLGIPVRTVQRAIKELTDKGYIQREGSKKSGEYIVLKPYAMGTF
ncbi:MAG TPA: helix-turn-helix domain-containing protein, partial [Sphaerochaeta sp.]|nr:helix-turn-helix domain-containing protein [Sphaerochaeta sp.]